MVRWVAAFDVTLDQLLGDHVTLDVDVFLEQARVAAHAHAPPRADGHGPRRRLAVDRGVDALGPVGQRQPVRRLPGGSPVRDLEGVGLVDGCDVGVGVGVGGFGGVGGEGKEESSSKSSSRLWWW